VARKYDWIVRGGEVVDGTSVQRVDIAIADEKVIEVSQEIDPALAREVVDATGKYVFPGIIDSHNHPYYGDDIEEFSLSAAYGGVTTLLAFAGRPLSRPQTDVVGMVEEFIADGQRRSYIDFGLHVILTPNDEFAEVIPELFTLGVTSYKIFLAFAAQKRMMPDDRTLDLMQRLSERDGICMVHCENGLAIEHLEGQARRAGRVTAADYVKSRPAPLESEAAYRALAIAEVANCDCYLVHLSAAESVAVIERYRDRPGARRYAETCPHYLLLDHHDQERIGGQAKISPPMREPNDRESLWRYLTGGQIDVVASDCSGRTCASKHVGEPNIFDVESGIPGVEQLFPLVYDEAVNQRSLPLPVLARVFCENPADIFGLPTKGRLKPGFDADLVIFDPKNSWTVKASDQHGNSDYSLYEGRPLLGRAEFTMQRGRPVLKGGQVIAQPTSGNYLPRGTQLDVPRIDTLRAI
jgi:dihydropyrimidinase